MKLLILGFLGLVSLASSKSISESSDLSKWDSFDLSLLADDHDAKLTVPQLIEKYGYPVETHHVTTEDGYILEMHRMPYGKACGPGEAKRVVYMQHGNLGDSSNWILAGPEKGLGYNLADACYDVWMGNYRGNTYSRNHTSLDPIKDKKAFWSFSWHEHGMFASIDYVLEHTGVDAIYYVGHSMGTTGFFVLMSERPEYNAKIKLMSAYAPVAFADNVRSPISKIAPFERGVEWFMSMFGLNEFMPSNQFMEFLGQTACHQTSPIKIICKNVLFLIAGYNFDQLDEEFLPIILGHMPAGTSVRTLIHYAQLINSGVFRKYDYGLLKNIRVYGVPRPPPYDIARITAPVAIYWGEGDWLAGRDDIYRLAEQLPNLKLLHRVEHDYYNHFDFIWAKDNIELINKRTIEFMEDF